MKGRKKKVRGVVSIVLALSMVLSPGSVAFAAEGSAAAEIEKRLESFSDKNLNADEAKQLAADYKALSDTQKEAIDMALASKLQPALDAYDALTAEQKTPVEKASISMIATYTSAANYKKGTISLANYKNVVGYARNAVNMPDVEAFIDLLNSIEEPYNNDHVLQTLEAYNKVHSFLKDLISDELMAKYTDIQYAYRPVAPSEEKPDISGFEPTAYGYAQGVNRARAQEALDAANKMLGGLLAGIRIGADEAAGVEGVALQYSPIDFTAFAGMGTLEVKGGAGGRRGDRAAEEKARVKLPATFFSL